MTLGLAVVAAAVLGRPRGCARMTTGSGVAAHVCARTLGGARMRDSAGRTAMRRLIVGDLWTAASRAAAWGGPGTGVMGYRTTVRNARGSAMGRTTDGTAMRTAGTSSGDYTVT
jgi:hypothetical protein